jgi:hypothetical protein
MDAAKFLIENFDNVDVLQKNGVGRSILTDAFTTEDSDLIALCLNHSSSTEERLIAVDENTTNSVKIVDESGEESSQQKSITHELKLFETEQNLFIRELAILNADNPFGSETRPEDDTTGSISYVLLSLLYLI